MVSLIASFQVKDGNLDKAIEVLKEIVPRVKTSEPGCLEYIPHTVKGSKFKNTIIFYEKYADEEALKQHMANVVKTLENFTPLLEPGVDLKTCYEIL